MRFDVITVFPEIFDDYFKYSLLKKSIEKKIISLNVYNLRDFSKDPHRKIDDKPYGGGRGMVIKIEPIWEALCAIIPGFKNQIFKKKKIKREKKTKIILFTPRGKRFSQRIAYSLSKLDRLVLICGRYEGIDERVASYLVDLKISLGDYILMGGELPALVLIEAVSRYIKGVVGKSEDLLKERIKKGGGYLEYPQYTRPEKFFPKKGICWQVPKVLLSGNHKEVEKWRQKHSKIIE